MAQYLDGTFSVGQQNGAPRVSFPLESQIDYYARWIDRELLAKASAYAAGFSPALQTVNSYTNLLTYSEDLSNAAWTKANATVVADSFANPSDGLLSMDAVFETAVTNEHGANQGFPIVSGLTYIGWWIAKGNGRDWLLVETDAPAANMAASFFNLSTGQVGTTQFGTAGIVPLGNGIFLCWVRGVAGATGTGTHYAKLSPDGINTNYAGDITKGIYLWGGQVSQAISTPYIPTTSVARTISCPNVDSVDAPLLNADSVAAASVGPGDPFAFLVMETEPNASELQHGVARWMRRYSRVPKQNITYSSMAITKPTPINSWPVATGAFNVYLEDNTFGIFALLGVGIYNNNYIYPPNNTVYGPLKSSVTTGPVVASGGTFTITYKTSTTGTLNYNDNNATIAAAINGLASVVADGITVTWTGNGWNSAVGHAITLTVGTTISPFTINAASLTGLTVSKAFTCLNTPALQTAVLAAKAVIGSHGYAGTEKLIFAENVSSADMGILQNTAWSVVNSNTLAVCPLVAGGLASNNANLFGIYLRTYTPGPDRVGVKLVQDFYLPGVTVGITTAADIPIPAPLINDADFLAAVVSNLTGYLNYDADPLSFWIGAIQTQVQKQINMADV